MNSTNITLFSPDILTVLIVDLLFYIDTAIRFSSASIHLFYFLMIYLIPDLQNKTLIFVHHSNVISFCFNLHYLLYFNFVHPNFNNQHLNDTLCFISEVVWALLKVLRPYSVALIATYRLIAVFKPNHFKFINKTRNYFIINFLIVYLFSIFNYIISKYWFKTTYGYLYCFDGFSASYEASLHYFIFQSVIGIILPTLFTSSSYYMITHKLNSVGISVQNDAEISKKPRTRKLRTKDKKIVQQFFFINLSEIISSIMVIGLGLRYLIPNLNEYYNITRFLLRTINIFFQLLIPIVSMIYNPSVGVKFKEWKDLLLKSN